MGFYSQVQITAETGAFLMFKDVMDIFKINCQYMEKDGIHVIDIDWIKWYPEFDVVKETEEILKKLCSDGYTDRDGYAFKMIILNEDNTTEISSNNIGEEKFGDCEVDCQIVNPYAQTQQEENTEKTEESCSGEHTETGHDTKLFSADIYDRKTYDSVNIILEAGSYEEAEEKIRRMLNIPEGRISDNTRSFSVEEADKYRITDLFEYTRKYLNEND